MTQALQLMVAALALGSPVTSWTPPALVADSGSVRSHAEYSFQQLQQQQTGLTASNNGSSGHSRNEAGFPPDEFVIGKGHGDMAKGVLVCQRVSELSARTDLAKQIRVLVKEHMIDRVRERSGRGVDQDIELTREEIVQEYLQGVKIVDRHIDVEKNICSATAVMPKSQVLQPGPLIDRQETTPAITR
ncbi:MAG: hypothetical protein K0S79_2079 [Nitrospira sp.]|nr:hypothetical protein [Nitrospira sp.]